MNHYKMVDKISGSKKLINKMCFHVNFNHLSGKGQSFNLKPGAGLKTKPTKTALLKTAAYKLSEFIYFKSFFKRYCFIEK